MRRLVTQLGLLLASGCAVGWFAPLRACAEDRAVVVSAPVGRLPATGDESPETVEASGGSSGSGLAEAPEPRDPPEPGEPIFRLVNQPGLMEPDEAAAMDLGLEMAPSGDLQIRGVRSRSLSANVDFISGSEAPLLVATDAGNLLGKSPSATGVAMQQRTPIVTDVRVRGSHVGELLASGSYWIPARADLDTLLSKIDSRIVEDMILIKGPYAVEYGPGFNFVDINLLTAPRFENGFESHGLTSAEYKTNGEQFYGRQSFWAGNENWGARVGYGHRTGNNYTTGAGTELPTSYNSRIVDVALGYDPSRDSTLEFSYIRLDQTGVEFPGLVFDINFLVTDAFELDYVLRDQPRFDRLDVQVWYNQTRFAGDTFRPGKNAQIPSLRFDLFPFDGTGSAITDVDASSAGHRLIFTWGDEGGPQWRLGTDLIYLSTQLNDIEDPTGFPANYPIPRSYSLDVGLLAEHVRPVSSRTTVKVGARVDWVKTDARDEVPLALSTMTDFFGTELDQQFNLWAAFVTLEHEVSDSWTATMGGGYAMRPPTLTELYSAGSFIGVLQPGLNFLSGDPALRPPQVCQIDAGVQAEYDRVRFSANFFHSWVIDHIVLEDLFTRAFGLTPTVNFLNTAYGNTDLATFAGFEIHADGDVNDWLAVFANVSYVEGRDHTRGSATRTAIRDRTSIGLTPEPRSLLPGVPSEPLPGIPPMESLLGVRVHERGETPRWFVEVTARVVDTQDQIAGSLFEIPTAGFTIWNLRSAWQATDHLLLIAGIENFTNKYYREHLDYRPGLGVFQPGVNFYLSTELTY